MPDGDNVHVNLKYRYQKVYKQICEGQYDNVALAHEALRPLKRDLRDYGAEPLILLRQVTTMLSQIPDEPLLKQCVDWGEKSQLIDRWAQQISGRPTAMELAVKACKQQLQELRSNTCPPDVTKELYKKYVSEVYKANFEGRVPLAQHYNGTSRDIVDARLQGMRAHVEQGIDNFVAQMMRNGSVTSLRRRPMARRPIGLNDDLLAQLVGAEG
jgi:hypothetical protein